MATTESEIFCRTPNPCQGSSNPLLKTMLLAVPILRPPQLRHKHCPFKIGSDASLLLCCFMCKIHGDFGNLVSCCMEKGKHRREMSVLV